MGKISDWAYLLFRPKLEKSLFALLQTAASGKLNLNSVLVDYVPNNDISLKDIYKLSVDAFIFGVFSEVYDTSLTAHQELYHDMKNSLKSEPKCNVTVREYIKNLAKIISKSTTVSADDINNLLQGRNLLESIWSDLQITGKNMYSFTVNEFNLDKNDWYAYGYPKFSTVQLFAFETKISKTFNITQQRPQGIIIKNISTVVAYYLSQTVD